MSSFSASTKNVKTGWALCRKDRGGSLRSHRRNGMVHAYVSHGVAMDFRITAPTSTNADRARSVHMAKSPLVAVPRLMDSIELKRLAIEEHRIACVAVIRSINLTGMVAGVRRPPRGPKRCHCRTESSFRPATRLHLHSTCPPRCGTATECNQSMDRQPR